MSLIFTNGTLEKNPAWPCVKNALVKLFQEFVDKGDQARIDLAKKRYDGLTYNDVQIEKITKVETGSLMVCIVVRNRGWARYDLEIDQVSLEDSFKEFDVPVRIIDAETDLIDNIKDKTNLTGEIVYLNWLNKYAVIVGENTGIAELQKLLNYISYEKAEYNDGSYNPDSYTTGAIKLTDRSIGQVDLDIYIRGDYKPKKGDPASLGITRHPMNYCSVTVDLDYLPALGHPPDWSINSLIHPDFDQLGDLVFSKEGSTLSITFRLKPKTYQEGNRVIKGSVTVAGSIYDFDVSFLHKPIKTWNTSYSNSALGQFYAEIEIDPSIDMNSVVSAPTVLYHHNENGEQIETVGNVTNQRVYRDSLRVTAMGPTPTVNTQVYMNYQLQSKDVPDSGQWKILDIESLLPMPAGATKIICTPISINPTENKFEYNGNVTYTFDDPARTPVTPNRIETRTVIVNDEDWKNLNMSITKDGYALHMNLVDQTVIDTLIVTAQVASYKFFGEPKGWFEHRLGYAGPFGVTAVWGAQDRSYSKGTFKLINEAGVTVEGKDWVVTGFEEGIWNSLSNIKPDSTGLVANGTLDLHIVQYNTPNEAVTNINLTVDGAPYEVRQSFKYDPVRMVSVTGKKNEDKSCTITVVLPEDGINAEQLRIERYPNYGDEGSMTYGGFYARENVDNKTVTFKMSSTSGDYTLYRIWFYNNDELISGYRTEFRVEHTV